MEKYFITGIDTDIGKTVAVGWLARELAKCGKSVVTQKLIQTGCRGISEDILKHRKIMGIGVLPEDSDGTTCKYVMTYPASPHIACAIDNVVLDIPSIAANTEKLCAKFDMVLIEGAGGIMVPLTQDYLTIDYILDYRLPTFIVVSSRLGSLNHALLSLEICRMRGVELAGIIYNTFPKTAFEIEDSTRDFLKKYLSKNFPNAEFKEMSKIDF